MKQLTTQEIQAILDGRKTQFREVVDKDRFSIGGMKKVLFGLGENDFSIDIKYYDHQKKETYRICPEVFAYHNANYKIGDTLWKDTEYESVVTGVRVERLNDIILDDIEKEGWNKATGFYHPDLDNALDWWESLWDSAAKDGYKWEDNPYVFIYEFKRVER